MSDSESEVSGGSQELNEVANAVNSSPRVKPVPSPTDPVFTYKGIEYRSVGVLCSPESIQQAAKEAEAKIVRVDRFTLLPDNVVEWVIDWTVKITMMNEEKAVEEADWTGTGVVPASKVHFLKTCRTTRHDLYRRLSLVSRRFYHMVLPRFWRNLDLSAFSVHSYSQTHIQALGRLLPKKPTARLPAVTKPSTTETANPDMIANSITTETEAQSSTPSSSSPPKKRRKKNSVQTSATAVNPSIPTFGQLVDTIVIGSLASNGTAFVDSYLQNLPNLAHVYFPPKVGLSLYYLQRFAMIATYALRTVDHLFFTDNGEDNEARVEAILTLFNAAPNLERFGVTGRLVFDELRGKRLAFIWKLNSRLKHAATGSLGIGLKQLYFGSGVELTVGFLRSIKESCPRMIKFSITAGVRIATDSTPQGGTPFDLAAFATQWSALTALTLISTDTFSTAGTLDTILKVCPRLTHLHLRSDHITYNLFATIVNELAAVPVPQNGAPPPSARPLVQQIGSETVASAALVQASKVLKTDSTRLKHPIKRLAISVRLGASADTTKGGVLHVQGYNILSFSLLLLSFQARGLDYPTEMGGQQDLINRAALMINLEHKKQREREQEEKARKKKQALEMEKEKDKGKGKEKEKNVEPVVVVVEGNIDEEEAIPDVEIISEESELGL